jgi:hypothetical protein
MRPWRLVRRRPVADLAADGAWYLVETDEGRWTRACATLGPDDHGTSGV